MEHSAQDRRWLVVLPTVGLGLKSLLLLIDSFPFHADEAVVGLMARHILRGEWPVFFYGQAYMGSLDATLVAAMFALLGESVIAIRIVQALLYSATIGTTMLIARELFDDRRVMIVAGALMAIPTVNVTLYSTVSLGGYGEGLLIGNLLLLTALKHHAEPSRTKLALAWGALAGLGIWVFGLTLVFSVPSGVLLVRSLRRAGAGIGEYAAVVGAAMLGASPWLVSALSQGLGRFVGELLGSAIAGASPSGLLAAFIAHFLSFLLFGSTVIAGLRPPWEIGWLAWPLLPLAAAFWLAVVVFAVRRLRGRQAGRWLLAGVSLTLIVGFLITPFGADPSGRYFVPLAIPLALAAGEFAIWLADRRSKRLGYGLIGGILVFNLWGTFESALNNPPGITTQFNPETRIDAEAIPALSEALMNKDELRGYTTYWVAYPLAFLSEEELIFVPQLPYHDDFRYTSRDDRYAPYKGMVETSGRVAYITNQQPTLDQRIRQAFMAAEISWQETDIGELHIFYSLSEVVRPQQIDLQPVE